MNIRKYALKSFCHNSSRGVVFMIALSVMLIIAVLNISTTIQKTMFESAVSMGGDAHVRYNYITSEQAKVLSSHEAVEWADMWLILNATGHKEEGSDDILLFSSSHCGKTAGFKLVDGHVPQTENQVALPPHVANMLGINAEVGEEFTLSLRKWDATEKEYSFIISGVIQEQPYQAKQEGYYIFVSEAFTLNNGTFSEEYGRDVSGRNDRRDMYIHFKEGYYPTEIGSELAELAGIQKSDYTFNYNYLYADLNSPDFIVVVGIILFVLLATGALVINNTFNMLSVRRTRSFSMLTLIGATKRQIRACIYIEALLSTVVALPIGLLLGTGFYYIGMPFIENGMNESLVLVRYFAPWAYALTILLAALMTLIGVARPAHKASKVTPVEAVRFSGAVEKSRKRRQENNLTTSVLARLNMQRNRGRTISIILSLSIVGVLFLALSTVGFSLLNSVGNIAKTQVADDIQIFAGTKNIAMPGSKALSLQVIDTLKGMDGVEKVKTFMVQGYCTDFEDSDGTLYPKASGNIVGVEEDILLELMSLVIDGSPSNEMLNDGISVLAVNWTGDYAEFYGQYNYELGRKITAHLTNESGLATIDKAVALRIEGIINYQNLPPYVDSVGALPTLIIPQSCFEPNGFFNTYQGASLVIDKEKHNVLASDIDTLCKKNGELYYRSYIELKKKYEQEAIGLIALVFMILAIIALVSILNLVSSTFIGIEQRQREFGILMALGISPKGLYSLLTREGTVISAISVILSTIFGLSGGYGLYWFLSEQAGAGYLSFKFPLIPFIMLCLIYSFVPYMVTLVAVRRLSRRTTVELLGY